MEPDMLQWLKEHPGVLSLYLVWAWLLAPAATAGLKAGWGKDERPRWVRVALAVLGFKVNVFGSMMSPRPRSTRLGRKNDE